MSNNVSKEKMEEYRQYLKELTEHQGYVKLDCNKR